MTELRLSYKGNGAPPVKLLLATLRAVERKQGRLISEARKEWERKFAGNDPSDACVTVRINGRDARQLTRLFPLEYFHQLKPFVTN
jgi:hypothetical protein